MQYHFDYGMCVWGAQKQRKLRVFKYMHVYYKRPVLFKTLSLEQQFKHVFF